MSKGLKGEKIDKLVRIDSNTLMVYLKNGNKLKFYADMCDYDDCELYCMHIGKKDNNDDDW